MNKKEGWLGSDQKRGGWGRTNGAKAKCCRKRGNAELVETTKNRAPSESPTLQSTPSSHSGGIESTLIGINPVFKYQAALDQYHSSGFPTS